MSNNNEKYFLKNKEKLLQAANIGPIKGKTIYLKSAIRQCYDDSSRVNLRKPVEEDLLQYNFNENKKVPPILRSIPSSEILQFESSEESIVEEEQHYDERPMKKTNPEYKKLLKSLNMLKSHSYTLSLNKPKPKVSAPVRKDSKSTLATCNCVREKDIGGTVTVFKRCNIEVSKFSKPLKTKSSPKSVSVDLCKGTRKFGKNEVESIEIEAEESESDEKMFGSSGKFHRCLRTKTVYVDVCKTNRRFSKKEGNNIKTDAKERTWNQKTASIGLGNNRGKFQRKELKSIEIKAEKCSCQTSKGISISRNIASSNKSCNSTEIKVDESDFESSDDDDNENRRSLICKGDKPRSIICSLPASHKSCSQKSVFIKSGCTLKNIVPPFDKSSIRKTCKSIEIEADETYFESGDDDDNNRQRQFTCKNDKPRSIICSLPASHRSGSQRSEFIKGGCTSRNNKSSIRKTCKTIEIEAGETDFESGDDDDNDRQRQFICKGDKPRSIIFSSPGSHRNCSKRPGFISIEAESPGDFNSKTCSNARENCISLDSDKYRYLERKVCARDLNKHEKPNGKCDCKVNKTYKNLIYSLNKMSIEVKKE